MVTNYLANFAVGQTIYKETFIFIESRHKSSLQMHKIHPIYRLNKDKPSILIIKFKFEKCVGQNYLVNFATSRTINENNLLSFLGKLSS
jgi:hypothetical protein